MDRTEDSGTGTSLPTDLITSSTRADMSTQHRPGEQGLIYSALSVDDDVVLRGVPASQASFNPTLRATADLSHENNSARQKYAPASDEVTG